MQRFNLFLPEPLRKWLIQVAQRTGISQSEHARRALDQYKSRYRHLGLPRQDEPHE